MRAMIHALCAAIALAHVSADPTSDGDAEREQRLMRNRATRANADAMQESISVQSDGTTQRLMRTRTRSKPAIHANGSTQPLMRTRTQAAAADSNVEAKHERWYYKTAWWSGRRRRCYSQNMQNMVGTNTNCQTAFEAEEAATCPNGGEECINVTIACKFKDVCACSADSYQGLFPQSVETEGAACVNAMPTGGSGGACYCTCAMPIPPRRRRMYYTYRHSGFRAYRSSLHQRRVDARTKRKDQALDESLSVKSCE